MKFQFSVLRCVAAAFLLVSLSAAYAGDHDAHSVPAVAAEPAAQLFVDAPLAAPLTKGVVVVPFRTEHLKIAAIYGDAALRVVPRIGHLHITLDNASWHWLQASDEPIVIQGLSHGPHQLTLELADANHRLLTKQTLDFTIP